MNIRWMPRALRQLRKLPKATAERITEKMEWYVSQDDPLAFTKVLENEKRGKFRFRVGQYRIFCDMEDGKVRILVVLLIKKRNHAYN